MRQLRMAIVALAALLIATTAASAQTRDSERSMIAIARGVGSAEARDSDLGNGFQVTGTIGRNLTPRIAIEVEVGGGNFDLTGARSTHTLNVQFASANLGYNWAWRRWYPFVLGGIGVYRYSETPAPAPHEHSKASDIAPGANMGGGVEFFLSSDTAVTLHARYHAVADVLTVRALRGSFSTVSLGFRRYF